MNFSQWPSSPPISFTSSNSEIDEFSLFIPNISLPPTLGGNPNEKNQSSKVISIFCEKDEVDDFIKKGFLFVYSINAQTNGFQAPAPDTLSNERCEKRYYKMIKKIN